MVEHALDYSALIGRCFSSLDAKKPLVFTITNYVTILDVAQGIRDCGALPAMWFEKQAAVELTTIASSLYINMGTFSEQSFESMLAAGKEANRRGIPVVVDLVAAGATPYITRRCEDLLSEVKVAIAKGNKGEITTICGGNAEVRGVESISHSSDLHSIMQDYSKASGTVLVASGKEDIITDGKSTYSVGNGVPELGLVVGSGCVSTGIVAAFASAQENKDYALSSALAMAYFGRAGELASARSSGTASFKLALFDTLYSIAKSKSVQGVRIARI